MAPSCSTTLGAVPDLQGVGLFLGEDGQAVLAFGVFEVDFHLVADLDVDAVAGAGELVQGHLALGLEAEIDDDGVMSDVDDLAFDDLAFGDELALSDVALFQQGGEVFFPPRRRGFGARFCVHSFLFILPN
jgi:hypothetical protein